MTPRNAPPKPKPLPQSGARTDECKKRLMAALAANGVKLPSILVTHDTAVGGYFRLGGVGIEAAERLAESLELAAAARAQSEADRLEANAEAERQEQAAAALAQVGG